MGKFGVSYLELLVLFEKWLGHRLLPEKTVPVTRRLGRPLYIGTPPVSEGVQIRLGCQFLGSLFRSLGNLPGGLSRFIPGSLGTLCFWKNFLSYVLALFALGIWTLLLCPCIFQLILAFGCCLWSTAYWIFREILSAPHLVRQWIHVIRGLWKNLHIFNVAVNSNPEAFALHSAEWRCVHSRCFWLQLLSARFARWKSTLFL